MAIFNRYVNVYQRVTPNHVSINAKSPARSCCAPAPGVGRVAALRAAGPGTWVTTMLRTCYMTYTLHRYMYDMCMHTTYIYTIYI
jgi:hypothetical protein